MRKRSFFLLLLLAATSSAAADCKRVEEEDVMMVVVVVGRDAKGAKAEAYPVQRERTTALENFIIECFLMFMTVGELLCATSCVVDVTKVKQEAVSCLLLLFWISKKLLREV